MDFRKHLIRQTDSVKDALSKLNILAADAILFVVEDNDRLIGSLTDGDIRRGFINGLTLETSIMEFIQPNPIFIYYHGYSIQELELYKERNLKIVPIIDTEKKIIDILNLRVKLTMLPLEAMIMAGGRGERLKPLTNTCPKPLLKIGDKPILEHNVDRLSSYGINRMIISIRYLGHQIKAYLGDGAAKGINIEYVEETEPLGTFGAMGLVNDFRFDHILLMNSDILTNIDFKDFYQSYIGSGADLMIASIPYQVKIPYAVLEIREGEVISFDEKPTYSYYSNGGIYLFKKELLKLLPQGLFYNATDFMDLLIAQNKRIAHYPILGYWLDIGKHEDYTKAQLDIKHIKF